MRSPIYYCRSLKQKTCVLANRNKANAGAVLMFHEICSSKNIIYGGQTAIATDTFFHTIDLLNRRYNFESLEKLDFDSDQKKLYITFDDIFESAYKNAIPELQKQGIPYTCFIAVNFIGKEGYIDDNIVDCMLSDPLCTIGAHTVDHQILRELSDEEAMREITDGKLKLEERCGRRINLLAFPYGSDTAVADRHKKIACDAGFDMAFSTYNMPLILPYCNNHKFFLPRMNVNESIANKWLQHGEIL